MGWTLGEMGTDMAKVVVRHRENCTKMSCYDCVLNKYDGKCEDIYEYAKELLEGNPNETEQNPIETEEKVSNLYIITRKSANPTELKLMLQDWADCKGKDCSECAMRNIENIDELSCDDMAKHIVQELLDMGEVRI